VRRTEVDGVERLQGGEVLYPVDAPVAEVQSFDALELVDLIVLEEVGDLEYFELEGVEEELVVSLLHRVLHRAFLVNEAEELGVGLDVDLEDECAADGAGRGLVVVVGEQSLDALVAEVVLVGTGDHGPLPQDVVLLKADVALRRARALPHRQRRNLLLSLVGGCIRLLFPPLHTIIYPLPWWSTNSIMQTIIKTTNDRCWISLCYCWLIKKLSYFS
jgi:hypothetical protein